MSTASKKHSLNYHNVRDEKGHFIQTHHAFTKTALTVEQTTKSVESLLRNALNALSCTALRGETMPELVTARRNLKNAMRLFTWWTAWKTGVVA